jgi:hypothetical protein
VNVLTNALDCLEIPEAVIQNSLACEKHTQNKFKHTPILIKEIHSWRNSTNKL